jgi:hypothetical protein
MAEEAHLLEACRAAEPASCDTFLVQHNSHAGDDGAASLPKLHICRSSPQTPAELLPGMSYARVRTASRLWPLVVWHRRQIGAQSCAHDLRFVSSVLVRA